MTRTEILSISSKSPGDSVGLRKAELPEFLYSRRFETRELAVQWAELERQVIEKDGA